MSLMRLIRVTGLMSCLLGTLLAAGCAAPAPVATADGGAASADEGRIAAEAAPTEASPVVTGASPVVNVDRSCSADADCTVKNVGNCCGQYPACVNVDSPTDPDAVMAECQRSGRMSVCGFPAISSCQCVQGTCEGSNRAVLE